MSEATAEDKKSRIKDQNPDTVKKEQVPDGETEEENKTSEEETGKTETDETEEGKPDEKGTEEVFEIVRESVESPPKKSGELPVGIRKRFNKLNNRTSEAEGKATKAEEENSLLREQNRLLELSLEQSRETPETIVEPKPDDFEGGAVDPEFLKKQREFDRHSIRTEFKEEIAKANKQSVETGNVSRKAVQDEQALENHYIKVQKMNVNMEDYLSAEDKAIEYLGAEVASVIIKDFDNAPHILGYLGTNQAEAEKLRNLIKSNPVRGLSAITRLESELKVKPKSKTIPNPDEELEGGTTSGDMSADERKLEKLRKEADISGNMNKVLAFKKEMREKAKNNKG